MRIPLAAAGNQASSGVATIGLTASFRPYLQLDLTGLAAPPRGTVYLLWVDDGTRHGFPLPTPIEPSASGGFRRRYGLSPALAPLLRLGRALDVLAVDTVSLQKLSSEVAATGEAGNGGVSGRLPSRRGTVVLHGSIPQS